MCGLSLIANIEQEEWFIEQMFWALSEWIINDS